MNFDAAISIGGQSLLDGLWRILQPAIAPARNVLPSNLPGFSNLALLVKSIEPELVDSSGMPTLRLRIDFESRGDLLFGAAPATAVDVPMATSGGTINLHPVLAGSGVPSTGTLSGTVTIPTIPTAGTLGGTVTIPNLTGTLDPLTTLGSLHLPAVPLTVPLKFAGAPAMPDATPPPLQVSVDLPISAANPGPATVNGLLFSFGVPQIRWTTPPDETNITAQIREAGTVLRRLLGLAPTAPLGWTIPAAIESPEFANATKTAVQNALGATLTEVLTGLSARTGRLVFPAPAPGSPCDLNFVPRGANAQIIVSGGNVILQLGFAILNPLPSPPMWPVFDPTSALDVRVDVSNQIVMHLLCCLLEHVPRFAFESAAVEATEEPGSSCCRWNAVRLDLWPLSFWGGLEVCISTGSDGTKTVSLRTPAGQDFVLDTSVVFIKLTINIAFSFEMDNVARLTNLQFLTSPTPIAVVEVAWGAGLIGIFVLFYFLLLPFALIAHALIAQVFGLIKNALEGMVKTLLDIAHVVTSPAVIPEGLFEAFGELVPATLELDDLTVRGTLQTPTVKWAPEPIRVVIKPKSPSIPPVTHQ